MISKAQSYTDFLRWSIGMALYLLPIIGQDSCHVGVSALSLAKGYGPTFMKKDIG